MGPQHPEDSLFDPRAVMGPFPNRLLLSIHSTLQDCDSHMIRSQRLSPIPYPKKTSKQPKQTKYIQMSLLVWSCFTCNSVASTLHVDRVWCQTSPHRAPWLGHLLHPGLPPTCELPETSRPSRIARSVTRDQDLTALPWYKICGHLWSQSLTWSSLVFIGIFFFI